MTFSPRTKNMNWATFSGLSGKAMGGHIIAEPERRLPAEKVNAYET
jgi:hypothetical protein